MAKRKSLQDAKLQDLSKNTSDGTAQTLTSNQGVRIRDDQNSLKAGRRGPSLLEDFLLREKITHFDHERIPERIVHAHGSGAHGFFQVYKPLTEFTSAAFLQDPGVTPVFVRFSTVAGFRGSSDLARDVRGFAVKFYTEEGNFDLVGNNMPVFFIQDALKFPDLIHAAKPEPDHEMPQAATAHDTFWDFISLMPESAHMIMWAMSDRAIPRSLRMMEGFGIHTFRLINAQGKAVFVKFHWKPVLGMHSVTWNEALKISGFDPDFHRRDLHDAIESGAFPEWELGLQIIAEKDEHAFDFDILDPTKLIPEELVPVRLVGKMTLNRNVDNFFAETEQIAFCPAHIVPGIDFSDDPLLQGRLFSYTDTQLSRLGGPNFHELPINRSVSPVNNNQRDGHMRMTINKGKTSYHPNTLGGGCPVQASMAQGGFASFPQGLSEVVKERARGEKFFDHFSQAAMFYISQSETEKTHIVKALQFELSKCETPAVAARMVGVLAYIDSSLAQRVADGLGIAVPNIPIQELNAGVPADAGKEYESRPARKGIVPSPALSMANTRKDTIQTRKVAALIADGFDEKALQATKKALEADGATLKTVAPRAGMVEGAGGGQVKADFTLFNTASVLFDAVYVPGGAACVTTLSQDADAIHFLEEAWRHCKTIGVSGRGSQFLKATAVGSKPADAGLVVASGALGKTFIAAIAQHRHWAREDGPQLPA